MQYDSEYWVSAADILRECAIRRDVSWEKNLCGAAISMDEVCDLIRQLLT